MKAIECAKFFMQEKLDTPRNTYDGNMKLQKLLYFAQLISLAKYNIPLFPEKIYAFEHGMVIDDIRKEYKSNYQAILNDNDRTFSDQEKDVLDLTIEIFGGYNADELSEITHHHLSWKLEYEDGTLPNGYHDKEESEVSLESLKKNEVQDMQDLIYSIEKSSESEESMSEVYFDGSTFSFDSKNISVEEIKDFVNKNSFPPDDYVAFKRNQEVFVY